jgi:hypothetical protein
MKMKMTLRLHLTPVKMAIINNTDNDFWWGCGDKRTLLDCWLECKIVQPLCKTIWRYFKKLKSRLPYYPVIPLFAI